MFQGETQEVEFQADKCLLDVIFDVFGDNVTLEPLNDNTLLLKPGCRLPCIFGLVLFVRG